MMKSKMVLIGALIIGMIVLCVYSQVRFTTVTKISKLKADNITKIEFFYQPDHRVIILEDEEKIRELIERFSECKIIEKEVDQDKLSIGYIYSADFYYGSVQSANVVFGESEISVNGKQHRVVKGGITTEEIDILLSGIMSKK